MIRLPADRVESAQGFTLVEMMVTLLIGMVIMGGLLYNFTIQSKLSDAEEKITASLEDLHLASQIMQKELRMAKLVSWDSNTKTLSYTTLDNKSGSFQYQKNSNDRIYWTRPGNTTPSELVRNLDSTTGMTVDYTSGADIYTVHLNASYVGRDRIPKQFGIAFRIWPRNRGS